MFRPVRRHSRLLSAALAGSLIAAALATTSPVSAQPEGGPGLVRESTPDRVLDRPLGGREAIRALGDDLAHVAARYDRTAGELRSMLRSDDAVRVDPRGRLFYVDPVQAGPAGAPEQDLGHAAGPPTAMAGTDAFALHSKPGAQLTIFLDFDGATVTNSWWHYSHPNLATSHPAWDPAGNGPAFDAAEKELVRRTWAIVAEDFSPFDVNVTTQDPGRARPGAFQPR